jgi:hypothetical protein
MPKPEFNLNGYALVAERITEFYDRYPTGRIITELISRDADILFRADIYRLAEDTHPATTGWALERIGDGDINTFACLENTETSAIGRALANLGFTASRKRPSYEEMEKAERARTRFARTSSSLQADPPNPPRTLRVAEGKERSFPLDADAAQKLKGSSPTRSETISDLTSDILALIREARQKKVPGPVLDKFRQDAVNGFITAQQLNRMTTQLRFWILNGYSTPAGSASDTSQATRGVNTSHQ